ncbi:hypothetical protein BgiBS90_026155 [Biomphalaria glabrata]|uniref:IRF tryptophan pentad repeat domain-containing protein n=1 Tax=Biomphalaria glabrata TaxID=6526 RepID=A0A2C9LET6_BIOGL|nr:hypothetical protein BgiBS90_026155 [Biomphalaria glabrata]
MLLHNIIEIINNNEITNEGLTYPEIRHLLIEREKAPRDLTVGRVRRVMLKGISDKRLNIVDKNNKCSTHKRNAESTKEQHSRKKQKLAEQSLPCDQWLWSRLISKTCRGLNFLDEKRFSIPWHKKNRGGLKPGNPDYNFIQEWSNHKNYDKKYGKKDKIEDRKKRFSCAIYNCINVKKTIKKIEVRDNEVIYEFTKEFKPITITPVNRMLEHIEGHEEMLLLDLTVEYGIPQLLIQRCQVYSNKPALKLIADENLEKYIFEDNHEYCVLKKANDIPFIDNFQLKYLELLLDAFKDGVIIRYDEDKVYIQNLTNLILHVTCGNYAVEILPSKRSEEFPREVIIFELTEFNRVLTRYRHNLLMFPSTYQINVNFRPLEVKERVIFVHPFQIKIIHKKAYFEMLKYVPDNIRGQES